MSTRTTECILNTNITKKLIDDDLFQKSFLLSEKKCDLFSRFILIFSLESPILQHFEEGLQGFLQLCPCTPICSHRES